MRENEGFVQAIAEEPTCDTRRLVYADWLEEHGNPQAADFLRTELALAKLPLDSLEAPPLRTRLWQAWATVNPAWLMAFTQPRMLRANPTPFPSAWKNFGLGSLRERQGTYGTWPYDSVPALPLDELRAEFQYLTASRTATGRDVGATSARYRQEYERMLADAAEKRVSLPEAFVKFMSDPALHATFHSVTGCSFTLPDEYSPIRANPSGEGMHVHFYCDSQSCLLWDLYVHASGGHCVIARWLDYFEPEPPDPDDDEPPYTGPRAWFVAPSFETFVYRVWAENQVWYTEHADFLRRRGEAPPRVTPAIQCYIDHYRNQQRKADARHE
jgi:uncharacterized protein (TIGR02996 family)